MCTVFFCEVREARNIIGIPRLGSVLPNQVENTLYRSIQVVKKELYILCFCCNLSIIIKMKPIKINSSVYRTLSFCQFINAKVA